MELKQDKYQYANLFKNIGECIHSPIFLNKLAY